ncbi:ATP-binding protein [Roseisolibacter sp. H3M3-2]|uniref:sensor histidine kinase n=1 Tax=Roseisolibacter sp. H3M3-2 TaxID=3031323 RepID=UPI0023DC1E34|nr:ATP-binding protein [Roseisolibacter sp. H3M3-2]MDF1503851.1 PAS domain-containing protein [Roseisolibacter sp. H3M3-2]
MVPDASAARHDAPPRDRRAAERRARDRSVLAVVEGMSDAFLALDRDWRVTYANREAARLNGTTPEALVGRDHWAQWPETRGTEVERQYRRAHAERVPVAFEHHYADADVWHEVRAYPAESGGLAVFYRDVTARKRLEAERARQARELADAHDKAMAAETQFRLLVDRVRDYAVFLADPDGIITHWGRGAERIKRWTAEEIVGRHLRVLYPPGGDAEDGSAEDHLRHAAAHGEYIGEGTRMRKDGTFFPARVVLTALHEGGRLKGFSKITQDLTGEREHARTLERATATAEAASTAKSQFLANTSHEIRTPLNAIIGYAELLDIGLAGPLTETQRQYLGRIRGTSRHLLALVNDVLDLSKIEAGEMRTAREPALVRDAAAAALQLVEPQARARDIVLVNGCTPQATAAYRGDPARVRQVLANLLSNAVRFTEAGGRVTLTCGAADAAPPEACVARDARAEPWTFVRVEDTGVGIAAEQLDRIWDAFVQADAARTRTIGGSGLGLTISRHLARLMGGDVTVRSRPGHGSSFVLWLPAADPSEVADAPADARADEAPDDAPRAPDAEGDGLRRVGEGLLAEAERVLAAFLARLRVDEGTPSARALGDAQLQDHTVTFVADVAQSLLTVGADGPLTAEMLRDGSEIQRLIAERHGVQRAQLGWPEAELRREWALLGEALADAVRPLPAAPADVAQALALIERLVAAAVEASLRGYRRDG